jgi:hypothetical protein
MPTGKKKTQGKAGRARKASTRGRKALGPAVRTRLRGMLIAAAPEHPDQLTAERLARLRQMLYERAPEYPTTR